jgi:hypothetical protein
MPWIVFRRSTRYRDCDSWHRVYEGDESGARAAYAKRLRLLGKKKGAHLLLVDADKREIVASFYRGPTRGPRLRVVKRA